MKNIRLIGISGSLREQSSNTAILRTIETLLPTEVGFEIYDQLHLIPPFIPGEAETDAIKDFKKRISNADGVFFSTPEYAFGVPGVLKNLLDWTVSTGEFNEKPVSVISASPLYTGGEHALSSLLLTLTALGTTRNEHSALSIPDIKTKLSKENDLTHPETIQQLQDQIKNLLKIIAG